MPRAPARAPCPAPPAAPSAHTSRRSQSRPRSLLHCRPRSWHYARESWSWRLPGRSGVIKGLRRPIMHGEGAGRHPLIGGGSPWTPGFGLWTLGFGLGSWELLTDVDDAAAQRFGQSRRAVVHVELLEDALDVRARGVAADAQCGRNFLVSLPRRQQLEDLRLAERQGRLTRALFERRGDLRRNRAPARVHLADDAN